MILRRAVAADASGLTACLVAAYAPYQNLGLPPVTEGVADDIRDHFVWVVVVDDVVHGGIVLTLGDSAHIANLAVHPDVAGYGIGKALIGAAMDASKARGHRDIHLATHAKMKGTQNFYLKTGWSEAGRAGNKVYFKRELH